MISSGPSGVADGARAFVLNTPGNPTGWTATEAELRAIREIAGRHGAWIISDEVYSRLVYDGSAAAPSMLDIAGPDDRLMVCNSFSKAWTMTGWRVGWMVAPPEVLPDLASLLEYNVSCVSDFSQRAGAIALEQGEPYVLKMRAELAQTKNKLISALRPLPRLEVPEADGAMSMNRTLAGTTRAES